MNCKSLDHAQVLEILPDRKCDAHKGNFGRILLLCGSRGYTGAAYLAAMGALRSGAGLVYLAVPESIYGIEAVKLNEAIVLPMPDKDGKLSRNALGEIMRMVKHMDAVLIGPGMGLSQDTEEVTLEVLQKAECPVVLDADGITLVAKHRNVLRERKWPTVLTPHEGEFLRLGYSIGDDRDSAAVNAARDLNAVIVLKGHGTVITDGNASYRNPTGNPGMAVGGSGDVLAGMIAALIGQGIATLDAAACAAWLHGAAGDRCADEMGQYGMLPTDMLHILPRLMK